MLSCLFATVLEQGTAPAENSTVACCCTGELPGCIIVTVLCAAVCEEQLSWKRTKRAVKKNTVTTQMFNVLHFRWTGHLPLAILYAPSASIWLLKNSLHTLLVRQP